MSTETTEATSSDEAVVTRTRQREVSKTNREYDVVVSDRIGMMQSANDLIHHMVDKQVLPMLGGAGLLALELSEAETKAYESALDFLRRQFEVGFRDTEPHEKRVDVEKETEFEHV
jgi:hypothetical protein